MELINLAWHVGAVIFGVWGLWIGLEAARDRALLHDAVLPLLLEGSTDSLSKSRFVRAVRYFVVREVPISLKGKVNVDLSRVGGVKGMTPGWEVRQLRVLFQICQIFQIIKAAKGTEVAVNGQSQDPAKRSGGQSREGIVISGSTVDVHTAALAIVARLQQQSSVYLRLQYRPGLQDAAVGGASGVSEVYWELTDPSHGERVAG